MHKYLLTDQEFPQTISIIQSMLVEKIVPGCVFGYWDHNDPDSFWVFAEGRRRLIPSAQPIQLDTTFDCASLTKVIVTTSLIALLCDRSWIDLDDSIHKYFPQAPKSEVKIRDLLTHSSGYPAWFALYEEIAKRVGVVTQAAISERQELAREIVLSIKPEKPVGHSVVYSDIGFWILGFIIEEVAQQSLDRCAQEMIFSPLGMEGSYFLRTDDRIRSSIVDESCAATFDSPMRGGVLQGQVDDDNCWAMGGFAGHAGLFSTIDDLAKFLQQLTCTSFIERKMRNQFFSESVNISGVRRALGWDMPSRGSEQICSTGRGFSENSIGHLGFTGTSLWYDRDAEIGVFLLTNRVHPKREGPHVDIFRKKYRPLIHETFRNEYSKLRGLA